MKIKRTNRLLIIISAFAVFSMLMLTIATSKVYASDRYQVSRDMSLILNGISAIIKNDPEKAMSSDPYDYIDNEYYNDMVLRGYSIIPIAMSKIDESKENGLEQYIWAICVEDISKTYLKDIKGYEWSNAKEWLEKWKQYLRNIPDKVEFIVNDKDHTIEEKKEILIGMGMMALPFIEDAIKANHEELIEIRDELIKKTGDVKESDIELIREIVQSVCNE